MISDELERADCDVAEMMVSDGQYTGVSPNGRIYLVGDLKKLKNIWVRQWEGLSHILWKKHEKTMFQTTNQYHYFLISPWCSLISGYF